MTPNTHTLRATNSITQVLAAHTEEKWFEREAKQPWNTYTGLSPYVRDEAARASVADPAGLVTEMVMPGAGVELLAAVDEVVVGGGVRDVVVGSGNVGSSMDVSE